jgi:BirA family biotin operon repressor/biotin-[acetyl-CoA-carboxylase] ligase
LIILAFDYAKINKIMNQLIFPILKHLDDGKFHSGETLAKHFRVSRSTIWNAIKAAQAVGISIFSVHGRGYQLARPVTLLNQSNVQKAYLQATNRLNQNTKYLNNAIEVHDCLASTNSYLMAKVNDPFVNGLCVATNLQTQGRGRRGRNWQARLGESLTFSVLWRFQCGAAGLSGLSLAVGVAIVRALHYFGLSQAKLKWPNDLVVKSVKHDQTTIEKLAGILIELQGDMEGPSAAVIGVGINLVLSDQLKQQIDQPSTAIANIGNHEIDPNELLGRLLYELQNVLIEYEQVGFVGFKAAWLAAHAYQDEKVRMLHPDGTETIGFIHDIADDGALMIDTQEGLKRFTAGEISLRVA